MARLVRGSDTCLCPVFPLLSAAKKPHLPWWSRCKDTAFALVSPLPCGPSTETPPLPWCLHFLAALRLKHRLCLVSPLPCGPSTETPPSAHGPIRRGRWTTTSSCSPLSSAFARQNRRCIYCLLVECICSLPSLSLSAHICSLLLPADLSPSRPDLKRCGVGG